MVKLRLQKKTTIVFVLIIFIPLTINSFLLNTQMEDSIKNTTTENFQNIAIQTGNEISRLVINAKDDIMSLSNNPILKSQNATMEEINQQLIITQEYHDIFDDITLIDPDGNVITSTKYNYRGDWKGNIWFNRSLNGEIVVSDVHQILNPYKVVIKTLAPVYSEKNETKMVVSGQIKMDKIWEILDSLEIGETGYSYLINNDRKIISHPDKDLIFTMVPVNNPVINVLKNQIGSSIYMNEDENEILSVFTPILSDVIYNDEGCWGVIISQRTQETFTGVTRIQTILFFLFLIFFALFVLIYYIFSRNFIKPISSLEEGMKKVSDGNLEYHVNIKTGDEIEFLADTFNEMTNKLKVSNKKIKKRTEEVEKLLQQKNEFIKQLSHDLRSPLTPIVNLIPLIEKKEKDPKLKKQLKIVIKSSIILKELIIKTLKLAQLNAPNHKLEKEKINLFSTIKKVINSNPLYSKNKNIEIELKVGQDITVIVDKVQIKEVIDNIISNAIKYSPNGGKITIDAKENKNFLTISISDKGAGINNKELEHIFDEFYKADKSRHDLRSIGLGLTITKRIIEKHGGNIWGESLGKEKGSTFYFSIPADHKKDEINISNKIDKLIKDLGDKENGKCGEMINE